MSGPCLLEDPGAETAVLPRIPDAWTPPEESGRDPGAGGPPSMGDGGGDGGGGDGGGGGGGGDRDGSDGEGPGPPDEAGRAAELAFGLFVVGAALLFASFLVAYALLLRQSGGAVAGSRPPRDLAAATLLVVGAALALAVAAAPRRRDSTALRGGLFAAATMAALLLAVLPRVWGDLSTTWAGIEAEPREFVLRALLGLFAALAAGGLGFIGRVIAAVGRGARHRGLAGTLRLCGLYWQFLTGLWLVLCGVLAIEG